MAQIFAFILHKEAEADDTAVELIAAARKIDAAAEVTAIVTGSGADVDTVAEEIAKIYPQVWKFSHDALAYPNAEVLRKLLVDVLPADAAVLVPHDTFGMDLAPGLAIKLDSPFVADVVGIEGLEETQLKMVRQEYGGMVHTHVACELADGIVITPRAGCFQASPPAAATGTITDKSDAIGDLTVGRRFIEVKEAPKGDVDITKSEVLVSIGRGIEDEDNIELAHELAGAMGADVACSRPIVDAKWLEKSRQVGTSGHTVKPKVYMALGISGSFQHMGGIKGNPFMVAVNKNPKAPIFQVADAGVVEDVLDFIPELTERLDNP